MGWRARACVAGLALGLMPWLVALPARAAPEATDAGAAIYRQGVLPGGSPLRGDRQAGASVQGMAAACATCHRRSGLGSAEGRISVPPIIGQYLFRPHATNVQDLGLPHVAGYRSTREPYTAETLARAIREGIDPAGRSLSYLMPRFALDEAAMKSLIGYLQGLTSGPVPGVTEESLHFATIVTPDADPAQRQAMLDVMTRFFEDKNAFIRGGARRLQAAREIEYRVSRRWQLHVWDLTGAPETWERQLQQKLADEPVFAVISGLGHRTWAPIHRFCERAALPCLFPNVELPVVAEADFYPVYFSRGVHLEVDLMMQSLLERSGGSQAVLQIYRQGDIGTDAAAELERAAAARGLKLRTRMLAEQPGDRADVAAAVADLGAQEALVLWLREQDVAALPEPPAAAASGGVLLSGEMGGWEQAPVPAAWRTRLRMTYPADLPELRRVRMNYPLGWFKVRHVPVVAERIQTDTYVACGILAETLNDMLDSFVRDYLVERVEVMLSHRLVNGYYPRLSLAPGQRFASKGGYLVRFTDAAGPAIAADGEWMTP